LTAVTAAAAIAPDPDPLARPRRVRADLRFLRIYALTVRRVTLYPPHPEALAASETPCEVADRMEGSLAGEASRYRAMGWCILALLLMMPILAGVMWSGMYWLPVSVYWWPFERGNYGLPFLSLFEWISYLGVAAYAVVTAGLLYTSRDHTKRLGTEYRRLLEVGAEQRPAFAQAIADGAHPRTEFVLRKSHVFSVYAELLEAGERGE